jgi:hypothetical protein
LPIKTSRRTIVALLIYFSISIHLRAEEYRLAEVFAGYSLLHGDLQPSASGWELSAGKNFNQWLGLYADFDAHHQSSSSTVRHQHNFVFGPQFAHRTTVSLCSRMLLRADAIRQEALGPAQGLLQCSVAGSTGTMTPFSRFVWVS